MKPTSLVLVSSTWRETPCPPGLQPNTRAYQRDVDGGHLLCMVSPPFQDQGWHLSISHRKNISDPFGRPLPGRYPTWDEIRDARYDFLPAEITMAMLLPPKSEYVNLHSTCFHLHEIPDDGR